MINDNNAKYKIRMAALAIIFIAVFMLSFFWGRYAVNPITAIEILIDKFLSGISAGKLGLSMEFAAKDVSVVCYIRFPRIAAAALVGAALSVAGASYQGMFRNPMVSPDLLGASTGAGFGAALAILLGASYFQITCSSFVFGLAAVLLAYIISRVSKMNDTLAMILAGVMISSLFSAGTSFIKLVADTDNQLPAITYWLMGSLTSVKMKDFLFALVPITIGIIPLILLRWRINLLTISDAEAKSIGIDTKKLRLVVIICATLMTAGSVAISGMIGWVGLVIPHFCRIIYGQDYRRLIPSSAMMGAAFLMLVDTLARTVTTAEIPLGILTSFVGAPVFIYLILSGGNSHEA